jgi:hypothetical protein
VASEEPGLPRWVFWSTRESIDRDIPSAAAIVETIIAVPLYWWIAIHFETYLLLTVSVGVAPLVLLRSDKSVMLGAKWFTAWAKRSDGPSALSQFRSSRRWSFLCAVTLSTCLGALFGYGVTRLQFGNIDQWKSILFQVAIGSSPTMIASALVAFPRRMITVLLVLALLWTGVGAAMMILVFHLDSVMAFPLALPVIAISVASGVLAVSIGMRVGATARFLYCGLTSLPRNFRRLILCTSPLQRPELIPGLTPGDTEFTWEGALEQLRKKRQSADKFDRIFAYTFMPVIFLVWFLPSWVYRLTLKSTAWFWWPLAYIGDDPELAKNPEEFHRTTIGSAWSWISLFLAVVTVVGFVYVNFFRSGIILQDNPLLNVIGYTLLVDWSASAPWQLLVVAMAILGIAVVLLVNEAGGQYRLAVKQQNTVLRARAEAKLLFTEYLARVKLVFLLFFIAISALQALLYFNSLKCWFRVPAAVERQAIWLYGERMPRGSCGGATAP